MIKDKLRDIFPSLLGYVETLKKNCIVFFKITVKSERTETE